MTRMAMASLLFLNHPEGIAFKFLPDYRKELTDLYQKIKPLGLTERAIRSIEDVTGKKKKMNKEGGKGDSTYG